MKRKELSVKRIKKIMVFIISAICLTMALAGCGTGNAEDSSSKDAEKTDNGIKINDIKLVYYDYGTAGIIPELQINITNNSDFVCESIQIEAKALDAENNIINLDMSAWIDNVDAGQSGIAICQFSDKEELEGIETIELVGYTIWDSDTGDTTSGSYGKTQVHKLADIPTETIQEY